MTNEYQIRVVPEVAAQEDRLKAYLADEQGIDVRTIFGVRTDSLRRDREDDPESKNSRVDHFLRLTEGKGVGELRGLGRGWLEQNLKG